MDPSTDRVSPSAEHARQPGDRAPVSAGRASGTGKTPSRRLDAWERRLILVSVVGGVLFALGSMRAIQAPVGQDLLEGIALAAAGSALWMPVAALPFLRSRPWATTAAVVPAGIALFATFGLASLADRGPAGGLRLYAWGSLAAAAALAAFGLYAHRDAMRRFS